MPTPATPANPNATITYTDNQLVDLQKSVASNLQNAGVKTTYQAIKPIHVPDERPENIVDEAKVAMEKNLPHSFNSTPETALSPLKALSEHLDYADQIVTGRTHVVDDSYRFTAHKEEKEDKKMQLANEPEKDTRSAIKKFVDWLHD